MTSNKTVLAIGADIKNRFLLVRGRELFFGPRIGDLADQGNYEKLKREVHKLTVKNKPKSIAHDLHPGYFSTSLAKEIGKPCIAVQHHHAHIASVVFEHKLKSPVIGISFDGTGFGIDGAIWGGEFMIVKGSSFKRVGHLKYIRMPGGDKVVEEPWRMVLGILGKKGFNFVKSPGIREKKAVMAMMHKNINSPFTSSTGRLFDAAASLILGVEHASFEAEGPIKLEGISDKTITKGYPFKISKEKDIYIIDLKPAFLCILEDLKRKKEKSVIAAKFHNSIAGAIIETVKFISKDTDIKICALSGGVFQNKFLKKRCTELLREEGFPVYTNEKSPVNDYNIALGQYHVSCSTGRD